MVLRGLQTLLGRLYDVDLPYDVYDFLVTDRHAIGASTNERRSLDEELLLAESTDGAGVALFVAGFFARSFARKLIDVDYHIAMGGNAYSSLADTLPRTLSGRCVAAVYAQLAQKFQGLVDALNEVSDMSHRYTDADILRLYEMWMKTGSPRARGLLRQLGVQPVTAAGARREH